MCFEKNFLALSALRNPFASFCTFLHILGHLLVFVHKNKILILMLSLEVETVSFGHFGHVGLKYIFVVKAWAFGLS